MYTAKLETFLFDQFFKKQAVFLFIKDIIRPYNCLLKNTNFSVKTSNE